MSPGDIPYAQGAVLAATKQATTIGSKGKSCHSGGVPPQNGMKAPCRYAAEDEGRRSLALFDVPEPDCIIAAQTSQRAPVGAPGYAASVHSLPRQRFTHP